MQFIDTVTMFTNPILNDLWNFVNGGNQHLTSFLLVTIITLIVSQISQCAPTDNYRYCLRCDDFNRQSKMKCATSYEDCGDCKTGFIHDEEDLRLCYAIEILEDPVKDIVQRIGSEVILTCIFNAKVWCVWTKDTNQVDIESGSRYEYLSPDAKQTKTHDCSIRIGHLTERDIGQWQCQSMADEKLDSVKGRSTQISIKHDEDKLIPTIKLNGGNVSYEDIYISGLQGFTRHKRDLIEQRNTLECQAVLVPFQLRWEIDGNVIVGGKLKDNKIHLDRDHFMLAMESNTATAVKLTCLVEYDNGQILTSYVIIQVEDKIDSNEQSPLKSRLTESSSTGENDVVLQKTLQYNGVLYTKPIQISIIATVSLLIVITVTILIVTVTVVVVKMKGCRNKK